MSDIEKFKEVGTNALIDELEERGDLWLAVQAYQRRCGTPDAESSAATDTDSYSLRCPDSALNNARRANRELIGARVIASEIQEHDGYLILELEHKGCDDEVCILAVDPADIRFRYTDGSS